MTGTRSRISRCFALTSQSMRAAGNARRSAAATGIACTMSPSAPSRTRRSGHLVIWYLVISSSMSWQSIAPDNQLTRSRDFPRESRDQIAAGMLLVVADDRRAAAVGAGRRRARAPTRPCSRCPCSARRASAAAAAARPSGRRRPRRSRRREAPPRARRDRRPAGSDGPRPSAPTRIDRRSRPRSADRPSAAAACR